MVNVKVSVIIPVYNGEKTLRQCLSSVLNQEFNEYEVIVVDNNSTDKTKEIIKDFEIRDKGAKYLFEERIGRGAARNTGEIKAKGEIILMTDADCIVPRNWIKRMVEAIEGYDAIQGFEGPACDNFWSRHRQMSSERKYTNDKIENPLGKIDTKNFAIKRDVLKKIGYTSRKYFSGNDTNLSIKLASNRCKTGFSKNIKVKHFHASSLKEVFKKHFRRAKWTVIISRDYKKFLKKTSFLKETCQTPWSFFKFFPGLAVTVVRKGPGYVYYDFVVGIAWRIGLLNGWLEK